MADAHNDGAGRDREAGFDAEFREYMAARWPVLLRTAVLLTGDRQTAEDVVQTALTRVYASWRRVRKVEDVDAYVRRVLVNAHLSRFRKKRVVEHLTDVVPESQGPDVHVTAEQRAALLAALAELPARQRAVVVLRYWEDMTESQVADVLRCSVGTVKSQASKGLARLRNSAALYDPQEIRTASAGLGKGRYE
ncbi:MAG: SigE family RNA polymerase sigma factor [Catenulispora sp.]|nr:SigE family RNA polymerase sigma factor [Catenulispora sp.]